MIAALRGRLLAVEDDQLVLEAGGVGYQVFCHLRTLASLHDAAGSEVSLHIHTGVSDDAIRLYGFFTRAELSLFRLLLGVERIGPRAALSILGRGELPALVRAIQGGDASLLATVPGVGRKTAERLILELRDRLDGLAAAGLAAPREAPTEAVSSAVAGLVGLGFRDGAARAAVSEAVGDLEAGAPVAALVSAALRRLDRPAVAR